MSITQMIKLELGEFPGEPVARTRHFHFWGLGSILGQGTKIPQAMQCGQTKTKNNNNNKKPWSSEDVEQISGVTILTHIF